ncbi:MAG: hypothetical protein JWQ35_965 [Bacteriovoracaceae bacterium]|nr:hypothetical protein [Bacteriovoracaceae bacterium]
MTPRLLILFFSVATLVSGTIATVSAGPVITKTPVAKYCGWISGTGTTFSKVCGGSCPSGQSCGTSSNPADKPGAPKGTPKFICQCRTCPSSKLKTASTQNLNLIGPSPSPFESPDPSCFEDPSPIPTPFPSQFSPSPSMAPLSPAIE